jgi:hypothetical protein
MDRPVPRLSLNEERERTIAALCEHFAADRLELPDFEARLDSANRAGTHTELRALLEDLPALRPAAAVPARGGLTDAAARGGRAMGEAVRETRTLVAFMGGVERRGRWKPARRNIVVAVMGEAELDFREVDLPPGETQVALFCLMGEAEIIVPPGLAVDASGMAIMGKFEHASPAGASNPDAPVLKITGVTIMGSVEIVEREPGETARDAKRRRKEEERERRHRDRPERPGHWRTDRDRRDRDWPD